MSKETEQVLPLLLTAKQAGAYMGVSENMARKLAYERQLPHIKLGVSLRFLREDLDNFILKNRIAGKS